MSKSLVLQITSRVVRLGLVSSDKMIEDKTIIGFPKYTRIAFEYDTTFKDYFVGEQALSLQAVLNLHYPVVNGVINDAEQLIQILAVLFAEFEEKTDEMVSGSHITIIQPIPGRNFDILIDILQETYELNITIVSEVELFCQINGVDTCLLIDLGYSGTRIISIVKGIVQENYKLLKIGGKVCTEYLKEIIVLSGYDSRSDAFMPGVIDIKEKYAYIRNMNEVKYDQLARKNDTVIEPVEFTFANGDIIELDTKILCALEFIFHPDDVSSLQDEVLDVINSFDKSTKDALLNNIILTGGGSNIVGIGTRLKDEIIEKLEKETEIAITNMYGAKQLFDNLME